jgi:DNA-binding IscR family transcriptional regulator
MRLTAQEEYGLRCLLQVARGQEGSVTTPEIAEREGLSQAHVHKLMGLLRRAGLVESVAGLGDRLYSTDFCGQHTGNERTCVRNADCSIRSLWIAVDQAVQRALQRMQLTDLLRSEPEVAAWIRSQPDALPLRTLS